MGGGVGGVGGGREAEEECTGAAVEQHGLEGGRFGSTAVVLCRYLAKTPRTPDSAYRQRDCEGGQNYFQK